MQEPQFFPDASGLLIHQMQIQAFGGMSGVRDPGLLSSAMYAPVNLWQYDRDKTDVVSCAAAYAVRIARNHPFYDGNKRTAAVLCETFLRDHGYSLKATADEWYDAMICVATGEWDITQLTEWLRPRLKDRGQ